MTTASRVELFENHDQSYAVWQSTGQRGRPIVHVDAHHDLIWLDRPADLAIGNYLCEALKSGVADAVWWVVPDGGVTLRASRRAIRAELRALARSYGANAGALAETADRFTVDLLGRTVTVCEWRALPRFDQQVLLDIDVDFFTISARFLRAGYPGGDLPWLWPAQLVERLHGASIRAAVVTIAQSVEGGFTPLKWKFLGDELAAVMRGEVGAALGGYDALRAAEMCQRQGRLAAAADACHDAADALPRSAAPWFRLAHVRLAQERETDARAAHAKALELDPSYATAYSGDGLRAIARRRYPLAVRAFTDALSLNPQDGHAHLGLARAALHARRWSSAERSAKQALAAGLTSPDVYRVLGRALERQQCGAEAAVAFQRSLARSLNGERSAAGAIASRRVGEVALLDPSHGWAYASLARVERRLGRVSLAIAASRLAIATGADRASVRFRLADLYARQRRWRAAGAELQAAFCRIPAAAAAGVRRTWWWLIERVQAQYT